MASMRHSYQITGTIPDQTRLGGANNVIVGTLIYFLTGAGNSGVVFIPDNLLSEHHVKETVRAEVRKIDTLNALAEEFS